MGRVATVRKRLVLACAAAALATFGARAQTTSATLTGRVTRTDRSAVAGAYVQARSDESGATRTTASGADGSFRFDLLAPGTWTVVARSAEGILSDTKTITRGSSKRARSLSSSVAAPARRRVTVRADLPLVDPSRTGGELRIRGRRRRPSLGGAGAVDLALLDSSVRQAAPSSYYGERAAPFVVNGQTGRANSYLVDGLDNNDQASGTTLNATFSDLVVSEFVLMTHQFSPEFGRASGGVLNLVTERGTNQASALGFVRDLPRHQRAGTLVDGLPDTTGCRTAPPTGRRACAGAGRSRRTRRSGSRRTSIRTPPPSSRTPAPRRTASSAGATTPGTRTTTLSSGRTSTSTRRTRSWCVCPTTAGPRKGSTSGASARPSGASASTSTTSSSRPGSPPSSIRRSSTSCACSSAPPRSSSGGTRASRASSIRPPSSAATT